MERKSNGSNECFALLRPNALNMRTYQLGSGLSGALFSSLTPIVALIALQPSAYGLFSVLYLLSAFGISLQYSLVSEAWTRKAQSSLASASWMSYSGALTTLSFVIAVVAGVVSFLIPSLAPYFFLLSAAAFFTVQRNGSRFFEMAEGSIKAVLRSDLLGVLAFTVAFVATQSLGGLTQITMAWCISGGVATLALRLPRLKWGHGFVSWHRTHKRQIRPLLADSLLMDAGAIGTPFLLVGIMGAQSFGVYRAISNAALPVRLLVDPIRPALGRLAPRRLLDRRAIAIIGAVTLLLSSACFAILAWLLPVLGFELGTLSSLTPHSAPSAIFVAGSLIGTIFYISCRTHAQPHEILVGRVIQTILVVCMPVLGYVLWGLDGAIWGFSISSVVSAGAWVVLLIRNRSSDRPEHALDGQI